MRARCDGTESSENYDLPIGSSGNARAAPIVPGGGAGWCENLADDSK